MAKVLVTGGTGFIGASLVAALLQRGDIVRILRRKTSNLTAIEGLDCEQFIGDVLDPEAVSNAIDGCDKVFHLAALVAYWRAQADEVYRVNTEGTRTVMEACLRKQVPRVVYTSSVSAIGMPEAGSWANEESLFDSRSSEIAYADSKRLAEIHVRQAVERGLNAVIVNPAQVVGPGDHEMYMGNVVQSCKRGRVLAVPSGGICMVDVQAVVQGLLAAGEKGRCGERYILGGENLSYMEIGKILATLVGKAPPRYILPRWLIRPAAVAVDTYNSVAGHPATVCGEHVRLGAEFLYYDSSKAVAELDYSILPFSEALKKAYEWYIAKGYIH